MGGRDDTQTSGRETLFSDADLLDFVREMYGPAMGNHVTAFFADDPRNESGLVSSVRRGLTRELDALIQRGKYQEAMRDG